METASHTATNKLGAPAYFVGGMSFFPLIGIPFGLVAIVWGLVTRKRGGKLLALAGVTGIVFTVVLYGALFYFGFIHRGGPYDALRVQLAQVALDSLVPSIEFYKVQHGTYPESLAALLRSLPRGSAASVFDPTVNPFAHPRFFYYERVGDDHYYLRAHGVDGEPFTADDVVPRVPAVSGSKAGLLLERRVSP